VASRLARGAEDGRAVDARGAVCALHDGAEARRGGPLPDARAAREPHDAPVGVSEQGGAGRVDRRARARRTPCQARPRSPTGSNARVNPRNRDWAADALKAVFSMESRDKALENAEFVAKDMESRKLREAAKCLREGIGETTTYLLDDYPREHRCVLASWRPLCERCFSAV